ncbi:tripartite tricarboxylate transporter TctB family protein [Fulvimarina endophytica]|uniref:Tripartite tricarboxylate transporter TctB family protein n=1 Tax=Fulvimarina endophytica TaxID=2293836 RepID=A0A371X9T5_9HYPH|nr:tripartite tricarboxylate transporter TctB family protein [Fulvimarina endophytica]RFC65990.1 tripartite tricarboxylate transporter TctB family protein [Fulvimarina endophytica]
MHQPDTRRPGEAAFAILLVVVSAYLLWDAYGIAGFESLSSPGAVPMATTAVMAVTALILAVKALKKPLDRKETLRRDILPGKVLLMVALLIAYAFLLRPLGFLPTSALFLIVSIKLLAGRGWLFSIGVGLGSLAFIYALFRIVFTVLMPAGIVPEAEMLSVLRGLFG